jgi:excisionase family DNA binding protein
MTMLSAESPRFLRIDEAAGIAGVSVLTLRKWMKPGRLRYSQPGGPRTPVRIPAEELERTLNQYV